ncbi:MAG: hypothetical protein WBO08_18700 [Mycobacterium sp.]
MIGVLAAGCKPVEEVKEAGTWAFVVFAAFGAVVGTIFGYMMGKDAVLSDVDPKTSKASPEAVQREQAAKAEYMSARGARLGEEKAAAERQKQADAAAQAERERVAAAAREEQRRQQAAVAEEQRRVEAERQAKWNRQAAAAQADQARIAAAVAAERAVWEQQHQRAPQVRRTFVKTETVQVADPSELPRAIERCINNNRGLFSANLSPDPPQVASDGLGAAINFFREDAV